MYINKLDSARWPAFLGVMGPVPVNSVLKFKGRKKKLRHIPVTQVTFPRNAYVQVVTFRAMRTFT